MLSLRDRPSPSAITRPGRRFPSPSAAPTARIRPAARQFESIFWQIGPDSDRSGGDFRHNSTQFSEKAFERLSPLPPRTSAFVRKSPRRSHFSQEE